MNTIPALIRQKWANVKPGLTGKYSLPGFYLVIILIGLLYYYGYIYTQPPQSIHRWRQTDSASITLNLYQHGMKFFQPEVHSLTADGNTTGRAAGEAPLLYYVIALLYKIFGPHNYIYRIANSLFFFAGLGALFLLSKRVINDFLPALFIPLLVFVSPVMAYYGNNYLPDTTSLALVFAGWLQYMRYQEKQRITTFLLMITFFAMAGLLKASMTLNLFTVAGIAIVHHLKLTGKNSTLKMPKPVVFYPFMLMAVTIITAWYLYAIHYNRIHNSYTFLTSITPWWHLNREAFKELTHYILKNNINLFYSKELLVFLGIALIAFLAFFKKLPEHIRLPLVFLLPGSITYINLYYNQFKYHDYYIIVLFSTVAFMTIALLLVIKTVVPKFYYSAYFTLLLFILIAFNVHHSRKEMSLRYFGWKLEAPVYKDYFTIKPYLKSIGIEPEDRVISIPDVTNCYTLYMMNQPGNTIGRISADTPADIKQFITKGAKYMMVNDTSILNVQEIKPFTLNKIGKYNEVSVFRIDNIQ